jgi:hypothetical protein
MKAGIFFTGSGPLLILFSYDSLTDKDLIKKLEVKGIKKFIAYEVPLNMAKEKYGAHYKAVASDLQEQDDLRVLDWDGHHVFSSFSVKDLWKPVYYEP